MWESVRTAERAGADVAARLRAAAEDIQAAQAAIVDEGDPLLGLDCRPAAESVEVGVGTAGRPAISKVHLSLPLLHVAVRRELDPLAVVAHLLTAPARQLDPVKSLAPVRQHDPPRVPPVRGADGDELTNRLLGALARAEDVVLVGEDGSGKAVSAARAARSFRANGGASIWIDSSRRAGALTFVWQMLRLPAHDRVLVVVNQRRLAYAVHEVRDAVVPFRRLFDLDVRLLTTTTPAEVDAVWARYRFFLQVPVQPVVRVLDEDEADILYWFGCLSLFAIEPSAAVADRRFTRRRLDRLRDRAIDRSSEDDDACYSLILTEKPVDLVNRLAGSPGRRAPGELIWEYLKVVGAETGRATLESLDLIGFSGRTGWGRTEGSRNLTASWDLLFRLGAELDAHCADDPSWGDNVGAAVFAAEALAELGHRDQWQRVAAYVRSRWRYDEPEVLPQPKGGPTQEEKDFKRIQRNMTIEDNFLGPRWEPDMLGEGIETTKFHSTWMLGVLLGFEGSALDRSPALLDALLRTAEKECHREGYFYPRRVPWVTARVVLGLCAAGHRYQTHDVVRRACDWLLRPERDNGVYGEWWRGGTGSWNRDEATTAMCVSALLLAEAPAGDEIDKAVVWLRSRAGEWTRPEREIDLALALEAILLGAHNWRSSYGRLLNLLSWTNQELRSGVYDVDLPEGALRVPFAAAQLAALVRVAVGREADALLKPVIAVPPLSSAPRRADPRDTRSGAAPRVELRPSVERWKQAAGRIKVQLEDSISSRLAVLRDVPPDQAVWLRDRATEYGDQLDLCLHLIRRLDNGPSPRDLDRLVDLGIGVCGRAWADGLSYEPEKGSR
ncbi:hypothetical protein [Actinoplanes sp. N902-109]|uniref:hypothetical protein n=1 Tax=Actinoplanes sp. (strain N902-109) TaxID=649831 RepID=UPI0003293942|nr:hypothetical protein [Actinoplanes sp. N902-109]AGL18795.1 hypothetical protein L083_5285 [Actinoplanes sp. N902-109]